MLSPTPPPPPGGLLLHNTYFNLTWGVIIIIIIFFFFASLPLWLEREKITPSSRKQITETGEGMIAGYTYTGMFHLKASWFWDSWSRTGLPFSRRFLERGIIFRTYESSSNYQQPFEIIHRQFAQKNTLTNKANRCTLCCKHYAIIK